MEESFQILDLAKVDPPIDAARDLIDPDKVRELAESIRANGLIEPILCRPVNGRFEVVAGHRRFLAHRLIGKVDIKSMVREMTDEEVEVARAVENDQREDLNPIEKAKSYKRLADKFGMTREQIAQKMSRSRETVIRFIKLLEIPEDFQKEVARGRLGIAVALCLNEIDDEEFKNYYFTAAVQNGVTLDVARGWVSEYLKTRTGKVEGGAGGSPGGAAIQEPLPIYQTCIVCVGPVEVGKVQYVPVCPNCKSQIMGALKPGKE